MSDDSTAERLPYSRRSAPRRAGWRGASTVTRVPAAGWDPVAGGQRPEEADEAVTDTIADVLDCAWTLEGAGLEEVSVSEEAVRLDKEPAASTSRSAWMTWSHACAGCRSWPRGRRTRSLLSGR